MTGDHGRDAPREWTGTGTLQSVTVRQITGFGRTIRPHLVVGLVSTDWGFEVEGRETVTTRTEPRTPDPSPRSVSGRNSWGPKVLLP